MKNFLTIIIMLAASFCEAQWQPEVRLTNDPAASQTSVNNAWCVASSGDSIHVVWQDFRDVNLEIYYCRSVNGGLTWGSAARLTDNVDESTSPSICVSGRDIHIVWSDFRDGNYEIYYKRSTDGGMTFEADMRLTGAPDLSESPSICVSGQKIHLVWSDRRDGNIEIYYKLSTNRGAGWGADVRLTSNDSLSASPSVSVSGESVHVVWFDERNGGPEIYYKASSNGGISWNADTRLTNDPAVSILPCIGVSGSNIYTAWMDNRAGGFSIYSKRSTNAGISWEADTQLSSGSSSMEYPSIAVSGEIVHIVWGDGRDKDNEIYYKRSIDAGVTWEPDTRLTNNEGLSLQASVSASGGAVHVVWQDIRDGNFEIYYKQDPTGSPVNIINLSAEIPDACSLEQNYPNPFNPVTNLEFRIANFGFVSLKVYDISGRESNTLVNKNLKPGTYKVTFDGTGLPSGAYFYKLETDNFTDVKKMILIK